MKFIQMHFSKIVSEKLNIKLKKRSNVEDKEAEMRYAQEKIDSILEFKELKDEIIFGKRVAPDNATDCHINNDSSFILYNAIFFRW